MTAKISILVCTHNREDLISQTIQSLLEQEIPQELYEILVVDNGSTDNTRKIVEDQFLHKAQNIKYIYEDKLGLSYARNTGWKNAMGEYVAFIDDDAIADPKWVSEIVKVFDERLDVGIAGGKVTPIWGKEPPTWIHKKNLYEALSLVDWGNTPMILDKGQWLAGVNVAYRKQLLEKFGGFNVDLGRKGKKLISNEENFLNKQIVKEGYKIYYSPAIYVEHYIPEERISKKWLLSRFYWQGYSDAIMEKEKAKSTRAYRKIFWINLGKMFKELLSVSILKTLINDNELDKRVLLRRRFGFIAGSFGL